MISLEEAYGRVVANLPARRKERIPFQTALHRILAEGLAAGLDIPPFNRAAMDGYALRAADTSQAPVDLRVVGEHRAGSEIFREILPGQALAITTGSPVPRGADAVQMIEHTQLSEDGLSVTVLCSTSPGANVIPQGAEASAGSAVLEAGRVIGPAEIAVLAVFGCTEVSVWRRPRVALLVTGDELVEVEQIPRPGQIRNSNAYSLAGQLRCLGIEPEYMGVVRDDPDELQERVAQCFDRDVIILTGGASVGKYDFVKTILERLGVGILFDRVAMKPGKPTIFARQGDTLVFGLPGNPVSSFVTFENFVRPALGRISGMANPDLQRITGMLMRPMTQAPGRTAFLPAIVSRGDGGWTVDPLPWRGSGDIIGFSRCNALVIFPGNRDSMAEGDPVEALLLPDFNLRSS